MIKNSSSSFNKTQKNNINPINFLFGFIAISSLIAFLIGGYLIGKENTQKENQKKSVLIKEQIKLNPDNLPSNPENWTSFKFDPLNIEFKLPEKLNSKNRKITELTGEKGKIICFSDKELKNNELCSGEILVIGSASNNYSSEDELSFIYNQGFTKENNTYSLKGLDNIKTKIENTKIKEFDNNNFEIIKILGTDSETTPESGYLGAIVNTKNPNYPSLVLIMKIESDISEYEFDQILKSIKNIND